MRDLLLELKNYGALGVKAEFESEGATFDEVLALKELSDLDLTVKIGGVGALNDINMARLLGAKNIVAPMVESAYAVEKFIDTINTGAVASDAENLYINIETITGLKNFKNMPLDGVTGVVFGRSDMAASLGGVDIESLQMFQIAHGVALYGKEFILGGAIGVKSLPFIQKLKPHKFETRKIIFDALKASEKGILLALEFELLWLISLNKNTARIERLSEMLYGIRQS